MSKFKKALKTAGSNLQQLPMVHNTDCFTLSKVVDNGEVSPSFCNHFQEELTYLFYGRPAYRVNITAEPTSLRHHFPVCLIFDPQLELDVKRVFPFDSGAFFSGAYSEHMHSDMEISDFLIGNNLADCKSLVSTFFGSNEQYFMGKAIDVAHLDPSHFEAQSYVSLINNKASNSVDGRSFCVEIQTGKPINILGAVSAIILPSEFCDTELGRKLAEMNIDLLPYCVHERSRPNEYMSTIADCCKTYLLSKGLL
ncbi:hypothetical protein [Thalassospira tepidiphila]|uniref:hypothetical protein n=1 Tax=Thalassospira tepidiphila TaxID=393657 RepID=UPI0030C71F31